MLESAPGVTVAGFLASLVPVTLGNLVGGGVFVALVYWLIYLKGARELAAPRCAQD